MGRGDDLPMRLRCGDRAPAVSDSEASMDPHCARRLADSSSLGVAQHRLPLALLGARWPDPLGALMRRFQATLITPLSSCSLVPPLSLSSAAFVIVMPLSAAHSICSARAERALKSERPRPTGTDARIQGRVRRALATRPMHGTILRGQGRVFTQCRDDRRDRLADRLR